MIRLLNKVRVWWHDRQQRRRREQRLQLLFQLVREQDAEIARVFRELRTIAEDYRPEVTDGETLGSKD